MRQSCASGLWALVLVALAGRSLPAQLQSLDPVERLRTALRADSPPERRDEATRAAVNDLKSLNDLCRAYLLPEWRDRSPDSRHAEIDAINRTTLAQRYAQAARVVLRGKDESAIAEVLEQIADLGAVLHARGEDSRQWWSQDFPRLARQGTPRVRSAAARAIGQTDPPLEVAVPVLASLLKVNDPAIRLAAADGLALLLERAIQRGTAVRPEQGAEDRLQLLNTYRVVLPVVGLGLADWHAAVRLRCTGTLNQAAAAIGRLLPDAGQPGSVPTELTDADEVLTLIRAFREQAPGLARALRDGDPQVRLRAQRAFEELTLARQRWLAARGPGDPLLEAVVGALPALAEAVADPEVRVRRAAIDVLEPLGPAAAPAVPALTAALGDQDRFVRWSAVRALGSIGPAARPAVRSLALLLQDPDLDIRIATAVALKAIQPMP